MKGRIGKYKDKIVVWGDPNLTAKNEINIDSLGGQADIPVEYYKVVAPEGENLDDARGGMFDTFTVLTSAFSCFHILVKGTSSDYFNNIFYSFEFLQPGISLQLKQNLVPITAEEFYNLDDLS